MGCLLQPTPTEGSKPQDIVKVFLRITDAPSMGKEDAMIGKKKQTAKARSPSVDINGIPEIYEKTKQAVLYIDSLSDNEPEVSKVITSCASIAIYSRCGLTDPFLVMDEMLIDCANHMFEMEEMLDPGTTTRTESGCPHAAECKGSDCSLCVFAPIRTIDLSNIRRAYGIQMTPTSGPVD